VLIVKKNIFHKKNYQLIFYIPFILFILLFILLFSRRIFFEKNYIQSQSKIQGVYISQIISNKIENQFAQLHEIGNFLKNSNQNPEKLTNEEKNILYQFLNLNHNINAINLISDDGKKIFWSTNPQEAINTPNNQFTLLKKDNYIGQDIHHSILNTSVLSMRIEIKMNGKKYFLSSPYKIDSLLQVTNNESFPWIVSIEDQRDSSIVGQIENKKVLFPKKLDNKNNIVQSITPITGLPLVVKIAASKTLISKTIIQSLHPLMWFTIVMSFVFILITYLMVQLNNKIKKRNQELLHNTDLLKRTNEIQDFIAQVNYFASQLDNENMFLQKVCELAVEKGKLALAVIGKPNDLENLEFLGSYGKVAYLDNLIISVNENDPFGQGPSGRAWRENKAYFNNDFNANLLEKWKERGIALNFKATATIPIYKNREIWGLLILYREDDVVFDHPMQNLLLQLASNISIGLDKIEKTNQLQLLENAVDALSEGLIITDKKREIHFINKAFTTITGYSFDDVQGKNCQFLQGKETDQKMNQKISQKLNEAKIFHGEILNVRKDGQYFWNQLHIDPIKNENNELTHFVGIQKDITKEKEMSDLQNALLENTTSGILIAKNRKIIAYNKTMALMLDRDLHELEYQDTHLIYKDDEEYRKVGLAYKNLEKDKYVDLLNIKIKKKDGTIFPCDLYGKLLSDQKTSVWTYLDATEREQQKQQIENTQSIYKSLVAASNSLLHSTTEMNMINSLCKNLVMNTNFHVVWLYQPDEQGNFNIISKASQDDEGLDFLNKIKVSLEDSSLASVMAWKKQKTIFYNNIQKEKNYSIYCQYFENLQWNSVLATPVFRAGKIWGVLTFITKENDFFNETSQDACKQVAALLGHGLDEFDYKLLLKNIRNAEKKSARTDVLTKLPNRLAFEEYLSFALKRAERYKKSIAVCFIDLDDFKPINDKFGHAVGDLFLQKLVVALKSKIRNHEFLARLGGDEFVLVLENLDEDQKLEQLKIALNRLHSAIENIFDLGEERFAKVGMTVGVSFYPTDAKEPDTLLRLADAAMYSNKTQKINRKNWWGIFSQNDLTTIKIDQDNDVDLFGEEANYLLSSIQNIVQEKINSQFIKDYQKEFLNNINKYSFLQNRCLNDLQDKQIQHFLLIISPNLKENEFLKKTQEIAALHSFLGFSNVLLEKYFSMYEKFLYSIIENDRIPNNQKYKILKLAISRIRLSFQIQIKTIEEIDNLYFHFFEKKEFKESENILGDVLKNLITLPEIAYAMLLKPDDHHQLKPILSNGNNIDILLQDIQNNYINFNLNETKNSQEDFIKKTWFSKEKQYIHSLDVLDEKNEWRKIFIEHKIKSAIAVPIVNKNGMQFVLVLYGNITHQFSSEWMKSWLQLLDNFFNRLFGQKHKLIEKEHQNNVQISRELLYQ
jgi:diguanylate cyclase (GGDEF)-like protein/PAS domain S-box-containing protein